MKIRLTDIIKRGMIPEGKKDPGEKEDIRDIRPLGFAEAQPNLHRGASCEEITVDHERFKHAHLLYERMYSFLSDIHVRLRKDERFSLDHGFELADEVIEPPENIEILYSIALKPLNGQDSLSRHSVNTSIFALKIGKGLGYSRDQQRELFIVAILHNIGMVRIPPDILDKKETLAPRELELIRQHTRYGYESILVMGEDYRWAAEIILQTHEREDGSGYPSKLKGDQIHEYAKIVGIADTFEAMTHDRPYRRRFLPHEAIKEITGTQRRLFSNLFLKVLVREISIFPLYSCVKLNSGAIGRVISTGKDNPLRPTIELIHASDGKKIDGSKVIRLADNPLLYIVATVDETDAVL